MVLPGTLPADAPAGRPPGPGPTDRQRRAWRRWGIIAGVAGVAFIVVLQLIVRSLSGGSYAFISMHGDYPITWNHCQAIRYQVNPKGAPENWQEIVHRAIDDIEKESGFVFADRGTSVKTELIGAGLYAGNEWEPVLIVWSDRYQDQMLDGGTIGFGGSRVAEMKGIPRLVIGQVTLDSNVKDPEQTQLVLEHELGHVLGLDHVEDPDQLMYPAYHGQKGLGRGDINGLKRLHDVPCNY
jgi:hypothetical protein